MESQCRASPAHTLPAPVLAASAADESSIGRRAATRRSIDLAGRFRSGDLNMRVQLENISNAGAAFRLMHPRILESGRLCWLGIEAFGEIVWRDDFRCGMRFADRLSAEDLRRTLDFAAAAVGGTEERVKKLASAWAFGPGDY